MTMRIPTTADIAAVETELWNVVRTLNAIEALATEIADKLRIVEMEAANVDR